jgi:CheY-like chemotaxis protein
MRALRPRSQAMTKRILLIDDEPGFTKMMKLSLEKTGNYRVQAENDPNHAIAAAREFVPHLILLDIMMPDMDGSELAALFMADEELRHIPIVFLTALVTQQEIHFGSFIRGGRTFLPKPVEWDNLIRCIEDKTPGDERSGTIAV